jgi:hypothetical protein
MDGPTPQSAIRDCRPPDGNSHGCEGFFMLPLRCYGRCSAPIAKHSEALWIRSKSPSASTR